MYFWRTAVHKSLKKQRKVALRMGKLQVASPPWVLRSERVKELLAGTIQVGDLKDEDFRPDIQQKGVDMKIGLDIASISNRRLADQIVLVTGDSDFVPAVKYARREGIDLVLDSLDAPVPEDLLEHVDGHQSVIRYLVPTRAPILRKPAASDER